MWIIFILLLTTGVQGIVFIDDTETYETKAECESDRDEMFPVLLIKSDGSSLKGFVACIRSSELRRFN
jgi:hypothetical protein